VPSASRAPAFHVALVRGINVGTAKRVSMSDLQSVVERLGYRDVRTVLNSGNVVFRGVTLARAARRIERALEAKTGISARVVVVGAAELADIVGENPLVAVGTNHSRLMVAVPIDGDLSRLAVLAREDWSPDAFALGRRAAYFWCPDGMLESRLAKAMIRTHGDGLTVRNWATIRKLHALTREPAG